MGMKGRKGKGSGGQIGKRKRDVEEEGGADDLFYEAGDASDSESELEEESGQKESAEEKRLKIGETGMMQ